MGFFCLRKRLSKWNSNKKGENAEINFNEPGTKSQNIFALSHSPRFFLVHFWRCDSMFFFFHWYIFRSCLAVILIGTRVVCSARNAFLFQSNGSSKLRLGTSEAEALNTTGQSYYQTNKIMIHARKSLQCRVNKNRQQTNSEIWWIFEDLQIFTDFYARHFFALDFAAQSRQIAKAAALGCGRKKSNVALMIAATAH